MKGLVILVPARWERELATNEVRPSSERESILGGSSPTQDCWFTAGGWSGFLFRGSCCGEPCIAQQLTVVYQNPETNLSCPVVDRASNT